MNNTEPLRIVFQQDGLVAVDKPPGMPVQPDRTGDPSLLQHVQARFPGLAVGSPHRLDRPVSGLVLFTLGASVLRGMHRLFRERHVAKTYLAIVEGRTTAQGELTHRLSHPGGTRKSQVAEAGDGGNARLSFSTLAVGDRFSLLELVPQGGAFHQIRAQLAAAGHPIKGDVKYGARRGEPDRSIALHAWRLRFPHPVHGVAMRIEAPLPARSIWPQLWAIAREPGRGADGPGTSA